MDDSPDGSEEDLAVRLRCEAELCFEEVAMFVMLRLGCTRRRTREGFHCDGAAALILSRKESPEVAGLAQMMREMSVQVEEEQPGRHSNAAEHIGVFG